MHSAAGLDDAAAAHDRLSAALARWRGGAFQEFGGLAWADLEASRLEELRLLATEQLAECALRLGCARTARAGQVVRAGAGAAAGARAARSRIAASAVHRFASRSVPGVHCAMATRRCSLIGPGGG